MGQALGQLFLPLTNPQLLMSQQNGWQGEICRSQNSYHLAEANGTQIWGGVGTQAVCWEDMEGGWGQELGWVMDSPRSVSAVQVRS